MYSGVLSDPCQASGAWLVATWRHGDMATNLANDCVVQTLCSSLTMDLYTLIPRTLVGVVYPAFMSLKSVLHGSPETATAWMRYWVVLGVFSLLELLLDPVVNPIR